MDPERRKGCGAQCRTLNPGDKRSNYPQIGIFILSGDETGTKTLKVAGDTARRHLLRAVESSEPEVRLTAKELLEELGEPPAAD